LHLCRETCGSGKNAESLEALSSGEYSRRLREEFLHEISKGGVAMAIRFLRPNAVKEIKDAINADPEFSLAARYFSSDVLFAFGNANAILKVRDGVVTEILLNPTFMDSWHFSIEASAEAWEKFLQPTPPPLHNALFPAMIRQIFRVGGDLEKAFAHFWPVTRMMDIMREAQNR
jgi:hypothetical protein